MAASDPTDLGTVTLAGSPVHDAVLAPGEDAVLAPGEDEVLRPGEFEGPGSALGGGLLRSTTIPPISPASMTPPATTAVMIMVFLDPPGELPPAEGPGDERLSGM